MLGVAVLALLAFSITDEFVIKITPNNTLSAKERREGFKLLFDGKSLENFRNYKKQTISKDWIIDDEAIYLNAQTLKQGQWHSEGGDIITKEKFSNFELKIDCKISPCANSGLIWNVQELDSLDQTWYTGPEMQILDDTCYHGSRDDKHRSGDLYDLISSGKQPNKNIGEWNHIVLRQKNGFVEQFQNGEKLMSVQIGSDAWNKLVAGSKFKNMPYFGKFKEGHIAIQDHGYKIWFRNIKIRSLD